MRLSLCMIVKDEAELLPRCLASVAGLVDQIVVVDTGSQDATCQVAAAAGAEIIRDPWRHDFAAARNRSLDAATGDWVLVLDADEELHPDSQDIIRGLMALPPRCYELRLRNLTGEDAVVEHYAIRLFPNAGNLRYQGLIHEGLVNLNGPLIPFRSPESLILHHGYEASLVESRNKHQRNYALLQRAIAAEPNNPFHYYNLGQTLRGMGRDQDAAEAFGRAYSLCWGEPPAYLDNTIVHLQSLALKDQDWERADTWTRQGESIAQLNPDYWINRGVLALAQGRISEAVEHYTQAYELGRQAIQVSVCDRASYTWKPFTAIAQAYQLAGDTVRANLFLSTYRELYPEHRKENHV